LVGKKLQRQIQQRDGVQLLVYFLSIILSYMFYFLPILGGQKAAMSDSAKGWCAAGNLGASRVSIRMDDRTDDGMDDGTHGFRGGFISHHDIPESKIGALQN